MTAARASAMKSPVRFMARGLAEEIGQEKASRPAILSAFRIGKAENKTSSRRRQILLWRRMRRQRRRQPQRRPWLAPGAGVAARDHPIDDAPDDPRERESGVW